MQPAFFEKVKARAYELWQAEGMLDGRHLDHWCAAEREICAAPPPPAPARRKRKIKTVRSGALLG